ncbi:unnamed protein product [Toxocara canis]|uniref:Peptidase_M13 domain-containing protein n=1 Tax=Toxocara canis TaxID=6265 RepID=A0A183UC94_TOXCA|nr:unnamed protein product [Toxocara canis]
MEKDLHKLIEMNDRKRFDFPAPGVNAFYDPTHNQIGRQYDEVGNLRNWWNNETRANFIKLKECIIEQYGSVEVPYTDGMHINGKATQSENIADNGGMRAAYRAMKEALRKNIGKEKRLRGLEQFSQEQLFFINYAYIWCGKTRPEAAVDLLLNDGHSPDRYRVNVVIANQPEFFDAFNCPPGSAMMMNKTCRVW